MWGSLQPCPGGFSRFPLIMGWLQPNLSLKDMPGDDSIWITNHHVQRLSGGVSPRGNQKLVAFRKNLLLSCWLLFPLLEVTAEGTGSLCSF